jgi:hypothetical protein
MLLGVSMSLKSLRIDLKGNDYIKDENLAKLFSSMRNDLILIDLVNANF